MRFQVRAVLLIVSSLVAASVDLAGAGGGGVPCGPGTFSPDGFQACTPCAPRTFTSVQRSVQCSACDCDDLTVCTLDTCNAATGVCSAEAAPECELVRVEFAGVVDQVIGTPSPVSVGMPIEGSYIVDPAAPDYDPLHPAFGQYDSAARSLELRVGQPVALEATGPIGSIHILDGSPALQDTYALTSGLVVTTPAGIQGGSFDVALRQGGLATFASDALPAVPPGLSLFDEVFLSVELSVGEDVTIRASEFTLTTPEPNASALASVAAVALLALRHHRSSSGGA